MSESTLPGYRAAVVVCVSRVMDPTSPVDFSTLIAGRGPFPEPETPGLTWILNPADEAAVRMAVALAPGAAAPVTAVHVGSPSGEAVLREAMAQGAGAAVRLELPAAEPQAAPAVAEALAAYCKIAQPGWILMGQCTLDWGTGLVGPLVAELLGWPLVDQVLEITGGDSGAVHCLRALGRGERSEVAVSGPAVLLVSPLAYRPVLAPVRARLLAQRRAIPVLPATVTGWLARPAAQEATRPRPRPKDMLPASFSDLSAEDRLAILMKVGQPAQSGQRRQLQGDPAQIACQILDIIAANGCGPGPGRGRPTPEP